MSAAEVEPPVGCDAPTPVDPVVEQLDAVMAQLGGLVGDCSPVTDGMRIDRITLLERLRAVVAAAQAAETVRFAKSHTATQMAAGVHPRRIGKGIADQIGLACRISPSHGGRRLACARAWWFDLPHTYAALTVGALSERVAQAVAEQTRHLDHDLRLQVDQQLAAAGITGMGVLAAEHCARKYAYEADRQAYIDRGGGKRTQRPAVRERRVERARSSRATEGADNAFPSASEGAGEDLQARSGASGQIQPTPSLNASPDKLMPKTSRWRCRS